VLARRSDRLAASGEDASRRAGETDLRELLEMNSFVGNHFSKVDKRQPALWSTRRFDMLEMKSPLIRPGATEKLVGTY
jgi:hypothetical protein